MVMMSFLLAAEESACPSDRCASSGSRAATPPTESSGGTATLSKNTSGLPFLLSPHA